MQPNMNKHSVSDTILTHHFLSGQEFGEGVANCKEIPKREGDCVVPFPDSSKNNVPREIKDYGRFWYLHLFNLHSNHNICYQLQHVCMLRK